MTHKYLNGDDLSTPWIRYLEWTVPGKQYPMKNIALIGFFSIWFCQMFPWQLKILGLENVASISLVILNVTSFSFLHNKKGNWGISVLPGDKCEHHSYRKVIENANTNQKWNNDSILEHRIIEVQSFWHGLWNWKVLSSFSASMAS